MYSPNKGSAEVTTTLGSSQIGQNFPISSPDAHESSKIGSQNDAPSQLTSSIVPSQVMGGYPNVVSKDGYTRYEGAPLKKTTSIAARPTELLKGYEVWWPEKLALPNDNSPTTQLVNRSLKQALHPYSRLGLVNDAIRGEIVGNLIAPGLALQFAVVAALRRTIKGCEDKGLHEVAEVLREKFVKVETGEIGTTVGHKYPHWQLLDDSAMTGNFQESSSTGPDGQPVVEMSQSPIPIPHKYLADVLSKILPADDYPDIGLFRIAQGLEAHAGTLTGVYGQTLGAPLQFNWPHAKLYEGQEYSHSGWIDLAHKFLHATFEDPLDGQFLTPEQKKANAQVMLGAIQEMSKMMESKPELTKTAEALKFIRQHTHEIDPRDALREQEHAQESAEGPTCHATLMEKLEKTMKLYVSQEQADTLWKNFVSRFQEETEPLYAQALGKLLTWEKQHNMDNHFLNLARALGGTVGKADEYENAVRDFLSQQKEIAVKHTPEIVQTKGQESTLSTPAIREATPGRSASPVREMPPVRKAPLVHNMSPAH